MYVDIIIFVSLLQEALMILACFKIREESSVILASLKGWGSILLYSLIIVFV